MPIFIERFVLAVLAAFVVLLAVTNPMGCRVTVKIAGVIVVVILAGLAAYYSERLQRKRVERERSQHGDRDAKTTAIMAISAAPTSLATRPEVREAEKEEKIFVGDGINPEYLLGFFEQHTAAQAQNATKDYVGKWMKVSGRVEQVSATYADFAQVTFGPKKVLSVEWTDHITVYMHFRRTWKDRALILKRGEIITTIGQINRIETLVLQLDNCELVQ